MQRKVILTAAVLILAHLAWSTWSSDEGPTYVAIVFDVSGSMRKHGFDRAKGELIEYLHSLPDGTHFWILPFAENELPAFEGELAEANRDVVLREAGSFIDGLKAGGRKGDSYGFFTNIDEGVDAGKLAVLQQSGPGRRRVVLISDGISDPDAYHNPVDIQGLAKKIPDSVHLYLIDLTGDGGQLPASWRKSIGSVQGFQVPQSTVVLIPVQTDNLKEMLSQLPLEKPARVEPERATPAVKPTSPKPEPRRFSLRQMLICVSALLAAAGVTYLIVTATRRIKGRRRYIDRLKQEKEALVKQSTQRKADQTLVLSVDGQTKQFPLKPFTSIRFGTQEGVDLHLTDPDKGHIDGWIKINDGGEILLGNVASTFPFIVNKKVEVLRGQQYLLPSKATIQASKRVNLEVRIETFPEAKAAGSVDDLITKYQPKEAIR